MVRKHTEEARNKISVANSTRRTKRSRELEIYYKRNIQLREKLEAQQELIGAEWSSSNHQLLKEQYKEAQTIIEKYFKLVNIFKRKNPDFYMEGIKELNV